MGFIKQASTSIQAYRLLDHWRVLNSKSMEILLGFKIVALSRRKHSFNTQHIHSPKLNQANKFPMLYESNCDQNKFWNLAVRRVKYG